MYRGDYQLVGSEMSFFTRKLEAQLRFQQIPRRYLFKTDERRAELEPKERACCFILEDALNHWLGRVQAPSRRCYPDNVAGRGMLEYDLE